MSGSLLATDPPRPSASHLCGVDGTMTTLRNLVKSCQRLKCCGSMPTTYRHTVRPIEQHPSWGFGGSVAPLQGLTTLRNPARIGACGGRRDDAPTAWGGLAWLQR